MRVVAIVLLVLAALVACTRDAVDADAATDALFQVPGAQFVRGALPAPGGGPSVESASFGLPPVAGTSNNGIFGELSQTATAVAFGLEGDLGYWIVRADVPAVSAPRSPTFRATYGIAATLSAGTRSVVFAAVDASLRFGPPRSYPLQIASDDPGARFAVSLNWANAADLDLHVALPNGVELFARNPTEYQRPPASQGPVAADASFDGGYLEQDSNARCTLDGQQRERAIWKDPPPGGRYLVRVDTFSLCGAASAPWKVTATLDGKVIGAASGIATEADQRFAHGRGSGLLVLELDVP